MWKTDAETDVETPCGDPVWRPDAETRVCVGLGGGGGGGGCIILTGARWLRVAPSVYT